MPFRTLEWVATKPIAFGKVMLPTKAQAINTPNIVPKISGKYVLAIPAAVGKMGA